MQTVSPSWKRHPWLGFMEESADGVMKHMTSGTAFPGTFPFIDSYGVGDLEGLTLIVNPTDSFLLEAPEYEHYARFPLCQLDYF